MQLVSDRGNLRQLAADCRAVTKMQYWHGKLKRAVLSRNIRRAA